MTKSNIYYVNSLQNPIYFINSLIIYSHFKFCEIEVQLPIDDIWLKTCFFFFLFLTHTEKKCAFKFMLYHEKFPRSFQSSKNIAFNDSITF